MVTELTRNDQTDKTREARQKQLIVNIIADSNMDSISYEKDKVSLLLVK